MAKIPDFDSLEEVIEFWDTHSFADYVDDTEPVEFEVDLRSRKESTARLVVGIETSEHRRARAKLPVELREYKTGIIITLDETSTRFLKDEAQAQGVSPGELILLWLKERLQQAKTS
jgi:hypothetical protein